MFQTKIDISEATRKSVIAILSQRLADAIDVAQLAKHAHWNVKGANFIAINKLFDKIHEELESSSDLIAERIAQLGGYVEGTCKTVAKETSLSDYPEGVVDEFDHVEALASALAEFGKVVREGIGKTASLRDAGTADILTQISRGLDKNLWFLENHNHRVIGVRTPEKSLSIERSGRMKPRPGVSQARM